MMRCLTLLIIIIIEAIALALAKNLPIISDDLMPQTLHYEFNQIHNVGYKFAYKLSDGQSREEYGFYDDNRVWHVEGFYSYNKDDKEFIVNYTADQNGKRCETTI